MNVLSLFDGVSCAKIALDNLEIGVNHYFASEIDKFAINVSKYHHPNIVHLGDIKNIKAENLLDEDIRDHASFIKDQVLSGGRNIKGGFNVSF